MPHPPPPPPPPCPWTLDAPFWTRTKHCSDGRGGGFRLPAPAMPAVGNGTITCGGAQRIVLPRLPRSRHPVLTPRSLASRLFIAPACLALHRLPRFLPRLPPVACACGCLRRGLLSLPLHLPAHSIAHLRTRASCSPLSPAACHRAAATCYRLYAPPCLAYVYIYAYTRTCCRACCYRTRRCAHRAPALRACRARASLLRAGCGSTHCCA